MWLWDSREASVKPAGPAPRMAVRVVWVFGDIIYHVLCLVSLNCC
jgi:hypothetical protein